MVHTRLFSLSVFPLFLLLLSSDSCHSLHTMDQDYYEGTDYLSPVPADGERTEEFEYEVGSLRQTGSLIQLPVSVSFSLADEYPTWELPIPHIMPVCCILAD